MRRLSALITLLSALVCVVGSVFGDQIILEPTGYSCFKSTSTAPVHGFALTFDLSRIPEGNHIDLAELRLTIDSDTVLGEAVSVQVVAVAGDLPLAGEPMSVDELATVDSVRFSSFVETGADRFTEINVTELVDWWYNGKLANKGLLVFVDGNVNKAFTPEQRGAKVLAKLSIYYSK